MENKTIQKEEDLWEQFVALKEQLKREEAVRSCNGENENENCRQAENFPRAALWQFGQLTNNF